MSHHTRLCYPVVCVALAALVALSTLSGCLAAVEDVTATPTPPPPAVTATVAPTATSTPTATPPLSEQIPLPSSDSAPVPPGARARLGLGWFSRLSVSPDRTRFAVAGIAGIYVYETDSFDQVWAMPFEVDSNHEGWVATTPMRGAWFPPWDVEWSPDGTVIAMGIGMVDEYRVILWDAATGERLHTLHGLPDTGASGGSDIPTRGELVFRPDGEVLASNGNWNNTAIIWDVATGAHLHSLSHASWITDMLWLPDGSALATSAYDGRVMLWDGQTFESLHTLDHPTLTEMRENEAGEVEEIVHTQAVWGMALSPDGTMLATLFSPPYWAGAGSRAVWDVETGDMLSEGAPDWPSSGVVSPGGTWVATRLCSGELHIADLTVGESCGTGSILEDLPYVNGFGWTSDSTLLASNSSRVIHWDARTGEMLDVLVASDVPPRLVWSPDGARIALMSGYDSLNSPYATLVWDVQNGTPTYSIEIWEDIVQDWVSSHPQIRSTDSARSALAVYDRVTGERLVTLEPFTGRDYFVIHFAEASNGEYVAVGWRDGVAEVWSAETGEALHALEGHSTFVQTIAFSPDGTRLASASGHELANSGPFDTSSEVMVWDPVTGQLLLVMDGHDNAIYSVAYSPDGTVLASASEDHTVILWDPVTSGRLATLEGHSGGVHALAWSPDGATLASGSRDGTIILWDVATLLPDWW